MITLPQTKRWTGDGFGDACARIFTLIKRNEKAALYKRTVESTGRADGFEVFVIKIRLKGAKLPGGMVEEEDRDVYPSAGSFGKSAWHFHNLGAAEQRFEELTTKQVAADEDDEESAPEKSILLPAGKFTTKQLAEANKVDYAVAFLWLKANSDKVKEAGTFKPEGQRGKASKVYEKAS